MALLTRLAVRSVARLSPSFVRLELAGAGLADFGVEGPTYDVRIKLVLPGVSGRLPDLGEDTWWTDFQALPEDERGHVRTYTIRDVVGSGADTALVVDVVLHPGAHGPGSGWAARAAIGDEVLAVVPRRDVEYGGIEWAPGAADRLLIVADESAVPAACSILEALPKQARGTAYLEVPVDADTQDVDAPVGVEVRWLPREGAPVGSLAVAAVSSGRPVPALVPDPGEETGEHAGELIWETPFFSGEGEELPERPVPTAGHYAWIAGESTMVRTLRRHLVQEVGMPREQVAFMGYWREGVAMRA